MRQRTTRLLLVLLTAAAGPAACTAAGLDNPLTTPPSPTRQGLAGVTVAEPPPVRGSGYQREHDFGPAWSYDYDRNGCGTRDDILRRDLTDVQLRGRCTVIAGDLTDPYTGTPLHFAKATAKDVQIDHRVPLSLAWRSGARDWDYTKRRQFANDPINLVAVAGPVNAAKGDSGPGEWMPRTGRCQYAVAYVRVVVTYHLSVSSADERALTTALKSCPPTAGP